MRCPRCGYKYEEEENKQNADKKNDSIERHIVPVMLHQISMQDAIELAQKHAAYQDPNPPPGFDIDDDNDYIF
ncbi:hypothetical protein KKB41_04030 [Patescibacteria group bacterium]|nr:hypothetical protein [Patescibacteria group bacterium]